MAEQNKHAWLAGASAVDVTPSGPVFLFGYPHEPRTSTGVYDPLLASALALRVEAEGVVLVGVDVIWVPRTVCDQARRRIAQATGVDPNHVLISATHTHSGPVTARMASNFDDEIVPDPDPVYLCQLEDGIVVAAVTAFRRMRPATLGFAVADGAGLGTNRHDPDGPAIPSMPVVVARDDTTDEPLGVLCVCSMHPTVLHGDSTLISGDFPGLARQRLQMDVIGRNCPLVYHMGASGNQSPRHVTRGNTLDEARRLGQHLAHALAAAIAQAAPLSPQLSIVHALLAKLPRRRFPTTDQARHAAKQARERFERLRNTGGPAAEIRGAEVDWFSAQETLTLATLDEAGRLDGFADGCLPVRVQVIRLGALTLIGWPGEVFVEFALDVMQQHPDTWVITLANGDTQGYLVTAEAVERGTYEAGNALFASPDSGDRLVATTKGLLKQLA